MLRLAHRLVVVATGAVGVSASTVRSSRRSFLSSLQPEIFSFLASKLCLRDCQLVLYRLKNSVDVIVGILVGRSISTITKDAETPKNNVCPSFCDV